jgi:hypothetical protein
MSRSQLELEHEGMAARHELYAKYGIAAEAGQLFETELGTLLLCLRGLDEGWTILPDRDAAREVLDEIDRSTLGRLLHRLKRHLNIEGGLEESFSSTLEARNQLMHGFFQNPQFQDSDPGRAPGDDRGPRDPAQRALRGFASRRQAHDYYHSGIAPRRGRQGVVTELRVHPCYRDVVIDNLPRLRAAGLPAWNRTFWRSAKGQEPPFGAKQAAHTSSFRHG